MKLSHGRFINFHRVDDMSAKTTERSLKKMITEHRDQLKKVEVEYPHLEEDLNKFAEFSERIESSHPDHLPSIQRQLEAFLNVCFKRRIRHGVAELKKKWEQKTEDERLLIECMRDALVGGLSSDGPQLLASWSNSSAEWYFCEDTGYRSTKARAVPKGMFTLEELNEEVKNFMPPHPLGTVCSEAMHDVSLRIKNAVRSTFAKEMFD